MYMKEDFTKYCLGARSKKTEWAGDCGTYVGQRSADKFINKKDFSFKT